MVNFEELILKVKAKLLSSGVSEEGATNRINIIVKEAFEETLKVFKDLSNESLKSEFVNLGFTGDKIPNNFDKDIFASLEGKLQVDGKTVNDVFSEILEELLKKELGK